MPAPESERGKSLETASLFFGSPLGGIVVGYVIGYLQSGVTTQYGTTPLVWGTFNSHAAILCTGLGWSFGCAFEWFYRNNGLAALLFAPSALVALYGAFELF